MRWLGDIGYRIRALILRSRMERELAEEIEDHVRREADKLAAEGMSPEAALREARLRFGGEERFKEHARESWGVSALTDLGADLRFARRQLWKNAAFSTLAILTLALGIGGTVALSSVVYGLMVRPLPVPDEGRVVVWWSDYNWRGAEFDYIKDVPRAYESLAAFSNDGYTLRTNSGTRIVDATVASAELFEVLKVPPLLGRTFQPGDDRPGAEPVVVLGHAIWSQEFGSDPSVIGRRLDFGGTMRTVVGVMPEGFYFPTPDMDVFVPLDLDPADPAYAGNGWLVLTGRLRASVTPEQLDDDLTRVTAALDAEYTYPEAWDKTKNAYVTPLREYIFGSIRPALLVLLGAVGLVLLMACVNVAALLLTKTVDRTREIAVRAALGAGRVRLARQVLTESVLLGLVAGAIGVGIATGLFDVLVASLPMDASFRALLHLDWTALLTAIVLAIASGSLIALAPMRSLLRGDLTGVTLTDRSMGTGGHTGRMQRGLVVAEVLLSVVLVTGASLLIRTVDQLRSVDLGFDAEGILTMGVLLSQDVAPEERATFQESLLERAAALPGVEHVTFTNRLPLRDGGYQGTVSIPDRPDLQGVNRPNALYRVLTPDGFATLGAEIVEGRGLLPSDREETANVAVVNQTFARRAWGDESAIGRTYTIGFLDGPIEVVGVVRDLAVTDIVGERPMAAYYAWDQAERNAPSLIVLAKTSGEPEALAGPLRALVRELGPGAAIGRVETMDEVVDAEMSEALRLRFFLGMFSLLGIVLGSVGVYGVVSYGVERRRTEFGIRMALGAEPGRLLGGVLRTGLAPVALGIVGGTVVALFSSGLLASFLFGVRPLDPISIATAAGVLLATGVAAALLPALRASGTQPGVALRSE